MNGDDDRGVSRMALVTTGAGACLWLLATTFTITRLGVVVGLLLWVWGAPAVAIAAGGAVLWCRRVLARRHPRGDEQSPAGLAPAAC